MIPEKTAKEIAKIKKKKRKYNKIIVIYIM